MYMKGETMKLVFESDYLQDYLEENEWVDYTNAVIKNKAEELFKTCNNEIEKIKLAFEIRTFYNEKDYSKVYVRPLQIVIDTLNNHDNCIEMVKYQLPTEIK